MAHKGDFNLFQALDLPQIAVGPEMLSGTHRILVRLQRPVRSSRDVTAFTFSQHGDNKVTAAAEPEQGCSSKDGFRPLTASFFRKTILLSSKLPVSKTSHNDEESCCRTLKETSQSSDSSEFKFNSHRNSWSWQSSRNYRQFVPDSPEPLNLGTYQLLVACVA